MLQNRTKQNIRPLDAFAREFHKTGLFSCFINIAMLSVPLYMLQVYDRVLTSGSTDTLIMLTVLCAGLLLALGLVSTARSWLLNQVSGALDEACNKALFDATFDERKRAGDAPVAQPFHDLASIRAFMTGPGLLAFFDAPFSPFYFAVLFILHPYFGSIALLGGLIIFGLAIQSELASRSPLAQAGQASREASTLLESFARNAGAVNAMGMLGNLRNVWLQHHEHGVWHQGVAGNRSAITASAAKFVRMSLQVAILGTGAWLAIQQSVTPGAMIAASIIMSRALAPIEAAISGWRGFVQARSAYKRLKSGLEDTPRDAVAGTTLPRPEGHLKVTQASLRLEGHDRPVLQNISLSLKPGEALGIIGPSGAGKSTLARLLVGLARPSMGSVTLDGVEIADWPGAQLGPHIGYLPQEVDLIAGTVAENIARFSQYGAGGGETDCSQEIIAAARCAGAHELIAALPRNYETPVGENGRLISGGQRQRIALARALFGDVRLAVLDEPNASLDADGEAALREAISQLKREGRTVVVIAHSPSILRTVDTILVLNAGQMQALGPRDEIMAQRIAVARPKTGTDGAGVHARPQTERHTHAPV